MYQDASINENKLIHVSGYRGEKLQSDPVYFRVGNKEKWFNFLCC